MSRSIRRGPSCCAIGGRAVVDRLRDRTEVQRPETPDAARFQGSAAVRMEGAQPNDGALRGKWWSVYNDPALDALEDQVSISNQNVLAAEAQFRAARAAVRVTGADQFPTVTAAPSATRCRRRRSGAGDPVHVAARRDPIRPMSGAAFVGASPQMPPSRRRRRRDLENARLLYQSELASDYFQMQGLDAERSCSSDRPSYEQYLQLTQDRFQGGVVSMGDVALAQTQLETARAQLTDLGIARAQFEHAIAVLTGKPPSELSMPATAEPVAAASRAGRLAFIAPGATA